MFGKRKERGKAMIYIDDCSGCGSCIARCRHKAIEFIYLKDGRYAKMLHEDWCSGCGKCVNVCKNDAIKIIRQVVCKN
jgi:NAD-dependent dihydropyrimidine dehydrogenase PreA subunit